MRISPRIIIIAAAAALAAAAAHAEVATPWKIMTGQKDPLTDKSSRYAIDRPKSNPIFHGQAAQGALLLRCVTLIPGKPAQPELIIVFTGLTGIGRVTNTAVRYRWDDGPVHGSTSKSAIGSGARAIRLPRFISPMKGVKSEDPIADMIAAKRLRAEVQFASAEMIFLDFNVAGAGDTIGALGCPLGGP